MFVEFPIDVLYPYEVIGKELGMKSGGSGLVPMIINWYLNNYFANLFAGAWEKRDVGPLPVSQPMASNSDIQKCIKLLSKAKKPLFLLGSQSTLPPTPVDNLRKALEVHHRTTVTSTLFL